MRRFISAILLLTVLCSALLLCACGGDDDAVSKENGSSVDASAEASNESSELSATVSENEPSVDDGKVEYKVTVTDADGKAMANVMVQLCLDSCIPNITDENGVATFNATEADYKASVMTMPEGYTYATDATEYYFEEGSTSLTIALKAAE